MHFWLGSSHSHVSLSQLLICNNRFSSTVGQFVLAASLRSQVNPDNKDEFKDVSPERCAIDSCAMTLYLRLLSGHLRISP